MGKFGTDARRWYWLSRALLALPENPPADKKYCDCTPEEKAARYVHRAYEELTGEKFDRRAFNDMMNAYK